MDGLLPVVLASVVFVGTHFLLSHPLRRPLVAAIGEPAFTGVYAVVALASIGWMSHAYRKAPPAPLLWNAGDALWAVVSVAMLAASILFVGSLVRNPALPGPRGTGPIPDPQGVFAVTRHPMNWAFALWGVCHVAVHPLPANIVVALAIVVLALAGSVLQDRKKARLQPGRWLPWEAKTSFVPFAAMADGRARWGRAGTHTYAGGIVVWLLATWAHKPIAGVAAGVWRWL